ncbi:MULTISPECIES: DEAD/DEAH box helicase family protein [unclassified Curtobacterium]|uniref:DEAD/DEAH box helicase family protein n=1 Tax=unclassified Curtobacterium TaxID=257496 RepID=UPI000DA9701B|nr:MULTISPECIES: DEAD/DEAH box helicase family protein [unclassified Curtobacterium]MDT0234349.1 helicase C-terminal domain-containing protein [Curtobacterium sp. BRB10]WIE65536.1 helicase C-terminal domain-containing protein [Curtobacterium sp. MCLR17_036]
MVDFGAMLASGADDAPIEPRELHSQLTKAPGYGYLRDVQGQVLSKWHERRDDRDIIIKVNTGGGKTIDGLIILQSYLNANAGPALFVAPSDYLVTQVIAEAEKIGIAVTTNVDGASYLNSEAIGIINAHKLVNGRTVFSDRRPTRPRVPIGAVVIDDVHAAIATTREKLSLTVPRSNAAFMPLLELFVEDLKTQSSDSYLDVRDDRRGAPVRVPFWAWRSKVEQVRELLRLQTGEKQDLFYDWPAVAEVLPLCRAAFANHELTITPHCPPIDHVTSFMEAKHRVFLTATLADDSVLVTDFGAAPASVQSPITPLTAGDIGERMILAPQEINPALSAEEIRSQIVDLSKMVNTVVLVPSTPWAEKWKAHAAIVATKDDIEDAVKKLRGRKHIGLVVLVNRYDGIDLPDDACRVLVLDGLPEAFSPEDRISSTLTRSSSGIDDRQVQRIEQGMGRGVRSNEDHCVVFLLGPRLAQLTVDPRTVTRFSPATQQQLKLSRQVASNMDNLPMSGIIKTVKQALSRDKSWVELALRTLRNIAPAPGHVSDAAVAEREAYALAQNGNLVAARDRIGSAAEAEQDEASAGRLLELQATYADMTNPELGQQILTQARALNTNVTKPLAGLTFVALEAHSPQAATCARRLGQKYSTAAGLRLDVESIIEDLVFDEYRTDQTEEALRRCGEFIGLGSQRPEHDTNTGPDNLWALGDNEFWVIEAKTGAKSAAIAKRDMGQLATSMLWFGKRYDPAARPVPIMVHRAVAAYSDATPVTGMRIITGRGLGELAAALRAFATALAEGVWTDPQAVAKLLEGHGLSASKLVDFTTPQRGVKN